MVVRPEKRERKCKSCLVRGMKKSNCLFFIYKPTHPAETEPHPTTTSLQKVGLSPRTVVADSASCRAGLASLMLLAVDASVWYCVDPGIVQPHSQVLLLPSLRAKGETIPRLRDPNQ